MDYSILRYKVAREYHKDSFKLENIVLSNQELDSYWDIVSDPIREYYYKKAEQAIEFVRKYTK